MGNRFELVNLSKETKNAIDFDKMEKLRDVFGTDVPFKLVGDKPYWGANAVLTVLGFSSPRDILKANTCSLLKRRQVCVDVNGNEQNRILNFISIEDINKIILNSRKSNPMIDKWKETNRIISNEAVKSELGMKNKIDDALEINKKEIVEELVTKISDKISSTFLDATAKMQEDNRKFQLQLLDRIMPKEKNLKGTKYITDFVGGNKGVASQVNVELEKAGYLKRVVDGNDKHWEFTDIAKRLGIGEVVEERHYKTILYNEKANDIIEDMIGKVKENNSLLF